MVLAATAERRLDSPDGWSKDLYRGYAVELLVYGDRMNGRVEAVVGDTMSVRIPVREQVGILQVSTAHGSLVISLPDCAAIVPVSCRSAADLVRLQVIGPVEFVQRRLDPRFAFDAPVTLCWRRAEIGAWERAVSRAVDISLGGLRVEPVTTVWPSAGVPVLLSLDFPDRALQAQAETIGKTSDYGLRLRFTDLAPGLAARIAALSG
jgi:hypothetical protein